jgi:hypothetical protein
MNVETPRDFGVMTAQELAEYSGTVWTARCVFEGRHSCKEFSVDYECPTLELLDAAVTQGRNRIGFLVSRTDYQRTRQQPGPKWAKAFGGISGRCATNPEDVPNEMMTAEHFWKHHANRNSG